MVSEVPFRNRMAGLLPAIHGLGAASRTRMPGTRPGTAVSRIQPFATWWLAIFSSARTIPE